MRPIVVQNESAYPVRVRLLGTNVVVLQANPVTDLIQKLRWLLHRTSPQVRLARQIRSPEIPPTR
jgi:hypothetical protein